MLGAIKRLFDLSLFGFSVCISLPMYCRFFCWSYLSFLSELVCARSECLAGFAAAVPYSI